MDDNDRAGERQIRPPSRRAYGCFMAFGLFLASIGILLGLADVSLASRAVSADGVVTGFTGLAGRSNAVIEFTDGQGMRHSFEAGSNRDLALSAGERVRVLYDPADPQSAKVDSFASRCLIPLCFTIFGLVLAGLAWASLRKLKRTGGV
jgi:Protein of unknown function (DUF3592)